MHERCGTTASDRNPIVIRIERSTLGAERRGGVIVVADPLVAFAMLLDLERRRRVGEAIPSARLDIPGGVDHDLAAAFSRHLPWVDVDDGMHTDAHSIDAADAAPPRTTTRSSPHARAPSTSIGVPTRTDEESMGPLVSAAELAMLFGAVERAHGGEPPSERRP